MTKKKSDLCNKSTTTAMCLLLHLYISSQTINLSSLHFWSFTISFVNHCCHIAPNLAEWQAALSHICLSDCTTQDKRGGGVEGGGGGGKGWFGSFSSAISETQLQRAAMTVSGASQDLISHLSVWVTFCLTNRIKCALCSGAAVLLKQISENSTQHQEWSTSYFLF